MADVPQTLPGRRVVAVSTACIRLAHDRRPQNDTTGLLLDSGLNVEEGTSRPMLQLTSF
jgi:hypothetical protein